jgi:hypothetical protein
MLGALDAGLAWPGCVAECGDVSEPELLPSLLTAHNLLQYHLHLAHTTTASAASAAAAAAVVAVTSLPLLLLLLPARRRSTA